LLCSYKCEQVPFVIQDVSLVADFFVLAIAGMDMVLGVQWLAQLGNVVSNYNRLTMSFFHGGRQVTLQGNPKVEVSALPCSEFRKLVNSEAAAGLFAIQCTLPGAPSPAETVPKALAPIISRFSSVFSESTQLPPRHSIDHQIPLFPDAKPVNVRPYRYPHF